MNVAIVSGYFAPIHVGHVEYFQRAKALASGGLLYVIVNSDESLLRKKGKIFQTWDERATIVKSIRYVDGVYKSIDKDGSVCETLEMIVRECRESKSPEIITFCNGGDRTKSNIPEIETCKKLGIQMAFGLGDKIQSSSWILEKYAKQK